MTQRLSGGVQAFPRSIAPEAKLVSRGLTRRVGFVVPNFQMVQTRLHGSDMVALLPSRVPSSCGAGFVSVAAAVLGFSLHFGTGDVALRHAAAILTKMFR